MNDELLGKSLEVALTVKDVKASVDWYTNTLGFKVDRRHERGGQLIAVSLQAGSVRLLLAQDDGAKGVGRTKGDGLSLQITVEQDVDAVASRVLARGWTLDTPPVTGPHGLRVFRLSDPDGFRLTISSATPAV
jgi:uncharacterized glyoxalase superfamily protein PhnB